MSFKVTLCSLKYKDTKHLFKEKCNVSMCTLRARVAAKVMKNEYVNEHVFVDLLEISHCTLDGYSLTKSLNSALYCGAG